MNRLSTPDYKKYQDHITGYGILSEKSEISDQLYEDFQETADSKSCWNLDKFAEEVLLSYKFTKVIVGNTIYIMILIRIVYPTFLAFSETHLLENIDLARSLWRKLAETYNLWYPSFGGKEANPRE
jgi:hypothetical protein